VEALDNAVEMEVNGVKILILDRSVPPYEVMNRRGDILEALDKVEVVGDGGAEEGG